MLALWESSRSPVSVKPDTPEAVEAGHEHRRSLGARRITALVGAEDEVAAALWQAVGYSYDPHIKRFVRNV